MCLFVEIIIATADKSNRMNSTNKLVYVKTVYMYRKDGIIKIKKVLLWKRMDFIFIPLNWRDYYEKID